MRFRNVDGLRGLAAVAVILGHWGEILAEWTGSAGLKAISFEYFSAGRLGVVAFFCVSGFVIPFSFRGERPLLSFIISRFFRLYPAYWLSILLAVALTPFAFSYRQIAANLTMAQHLLGEPDILGVYWTLIIELAFYGICFVLFAAGLLYKGVSHACLMTALLMIATIGAVYCRLHPEHDLPLGLPTYLAAMHLGILARRALVEKDDLSIRIYPIALLGLCISVIAINIIAYYGTNSQPVSWIGSITGYMMGLVLFLGCIHRNWFAHHRLQFFGLISYAMYLFHPITLHLTSPLLNRFSTPWLAVAVLTPIVVVSTIVVAIAAQRFVEAPAVRLGKRLDDAVNRRSDISTVR